MKVIDINGKERDITSVKKTCIKVPDALHKDVFIKKDYAEVVIIGHFGRTWKEFYPLEDFKKANPQVRVK